MLFCFVNINVSLLHSELRVALREHEAFVSLWFLSDHFNGANFGRRSKLDYAHAYADPVLHCVLIALLTLYSG